MKRQQIAFLALGASCVMEACLIARLEKRVRHLEAMSEAMSDYIELQFREEVNEKFEEIVEKFQDDE